MIVSALVRRDGEILLVEQQGPWDSVAGWMLPGGRVEPGEPMLAALERELAEETGMRLLGSPRVAYLVELATDAGQYSALTFDCEADGTLAPNDPDGFIRGAAWVPAADAIERLRAVEWYDCRPLERYLSGEGGGETYVMAPR